jgi:hypothetical protein
LVEPVVSESQIPEDVWAEWENKTLPLNKWRREFKAVVATDDKFASFEDDKIKAKFLDSVETFQTPGKRNRDLQERFILIHNLLQWDNQHFQDFCC